MALSPTLTKVSPTLLENAAPIFVALPTILARFFFNVCSTPIIATEATPAAPASPSSGAPNGPPKAVTKAPIIPKAAVAAIEIALKPSSI